MSIMPRKNIRERAEDWAALNRAFVENQVAIEIRAAELAQLSREEKFHKVTPIEFDWLVHGEWPPHCPHDRTPENDEEEAAYLAFCILEDELADLEYSLIETLERP